MKPHNFNDFLTPISHAKMNFTYILIHRGTNRQPSSCLMLFINSPVRQSCQDHDDSQDIDIHLYAGYSEPAHAVAINLQIKLDQTNTKFMPKMKNVW